jgi:hypothetical protein
MEGVGAGLKRLRKKGLFWVKCGEKHTSGAKASTDSADLIPGINPWHTG